MNPWKKEDSYAPCLSCAHAEALQHLAAGAIKDLSFKLWLELSYILNIKHWDTEILSFKQMKEETTQDNYAKRKKKKQKTKIAWYKVMGNCLPFRFHESDELLHGNRSLCVNQEITFGIDRQLPGKEELVI